MGSDAHRFGGQRLGHNTQVRTDLVDLAVWMEVRTLQEHPEHLIAAYQRRLELAVSRIRPGHAAREGYSGVA